MAATKSRTDVWDFYTKGDGKVTCNLCKKDLVYRNGTSNLRDHLNRIHPNDYKPHKHDCTQQTLESTTRVSTCSEARSKRITNLIVEMIAVDMRPIRIVKCDGFLRLMNFVEPGYHVPSTTHISSLIERRFTQLESKLRAKLSDEAESLSLTSDIWTSHANDSYITVSCHYVSRQWQMKSFVLSTKGFSEKHTGVNVCEALKNVVREFGISEAQVVAVVHDQGSNYEVAADLLHENIGWYDVKCAGHCLQLCINSGSSLPAIDRMLSVSRKIVRHFHHSVHATEALRKRQKQMDVPVRKLKQYVATRWNSNLFMLESLLNSHWPIAAVLFDTEVTEAKYRYLDLKPEQWELLEKLVPVLQPLQTATTFLCYEYNVSCSCVLPVLFGILQALQVSEDDLSSISHFKIDVSSEIRRRWSLDSLDPS